MLGGRCLEFADERAVPSERQVGIDPLLDRRQPALLEPVDLDAHDRIEFEVGEGPPTPEHLCRPKRARGGDRIADGQRVAALSNEVLELLEVELARLHPQ